MAVPVDAVAKAVTAAVAAADVPKPAAADVARAVMLAPARSRTADSSGVLKLRSLAVSRRSSSAISMCRICMNAISNGVRSSLAARSRQPLWASSSFSFFAQSLS